MREFTINLKAEFIQFYDILALGTKVNQGKYTGVYVMFDEEGLILYVGKSIDLSQRIKGHRKDSVFYSRIHGIDFYQISGGYEREVLETHLINELHPIHNKGKTYFRSVEYAAEIEELDYVITELTHEANELRLEYKGLVLHAFSIYDRASLTADKRHIREQLTELYAELKELKEERQRLLMRMV